MDFDLKETIGITELVEIVYAKCDIGGFVVDVPLVKNIKSI